MDIKYKIEKKFKNFDLFLFTTTYRKKIKEKPMTKVRRYTSVLLKQSLFVLLALVLLSFILYRINNNANIGIILELAIYFIIYIAFLLLYIYLQYRRVYSNEFKDINGILRVDEKGITDISDVHSVTFPYEQIEFIMIYNELAFIIHKCSTINMCIMNYDNNKLLEAIKKYKKDLLVIQQTTRKEG